MMTSLLKIATITAASAALFACGRGNDKGNATIVDASGKHVANWVQLHPAAAASAMESCTECHGSDLTGGISKVSCMSPDAVSGYRCHVTNPAENPSGCVSCHGGAPNGPFGNTAPNRKGAHGAHTSLTGCGTCHPNAGSGTVSHARASATGDISKASVVLSTDFQAKTISGTFGYDANSGTCSGVSCHGNGGKVNLALPWSTGKVTIATDCLQCHEQGTGPATPQFNSFFSGSFLGINLHEFHLRDTTHNTAGNPVFCTDCHNVGALADPQKHLAGLTSNALTAPGATIGSVPTSVGSYDTATKTCSNIACHVFAPKNGVPWVQ